MRPDWLCEAYTPEAHDEGAWCFLVSGSLHTRVCGTADVCSARLTYERQRVFQRINELAAATDCPQMAYLANKITSPLDLLNNKQP